MPTRLIPPLSSPSEKTTAVIEIPDSIEWRGILRGLIFGLTDPVAWADTPEKEDALDIAREIAMSYEDYALEGHTHPEYAEVDHAHPFPSHSHDILDYTGWEPISSTVNVTGEQQMLITSMAGSGGLFVLSGGAMVCQVPGRYRLSMGYMTKSATGSYRRGILKVNGTSQIQGFHSSEGWQSFYGQRFVDLAQGDEITLHMVNANSSDTTEWYFARGYGGGVHATFLK